MILRRRGGGALAKQAEAGRAHAASGVNGDKRSKRAGGRWELLYSQSIDYTQPEHTWLNKVLSDQTNRTVSLANYPIRAPKRYPDKTFIRSYINKILEVLWR
jgi:hypothetical protein